MEQAKTSFQLYRGRGQAENFHQGDEGGFFGDKTDSSTLIKTKFV
ncbi:putative transposase [Streptococcus pneumoniae GA13494]|nr:putative transposase [Streptococcus pneumoniae GA13494]